MFLKRNKPRSIAAELVALFTLAATLLLSCVLGVFYWLVIEHGVAEDNAVLADKIRALGSELQEPDGVRTIDQELKSRRAGEPTVYWIRILDRDGRVLTDTPRMTSFYLLLPFTLRKANRCHFKIRSIIALGGACFLSCR
jgi:hypothetical protein